MGFRFLFRMAVVVVVVVVVVVGCRGNLLLNVATWPTTISSTFVVVVVVVTTTTLTFAVAVAVAVVLFVTRTFERRRATVVPFHDQRR